MEKNSKIYIAGHKGMVGSAIMRNLENRGFTNILTRNYPELDLVDQNAVQSFFESEKPDYVIDAAAKVGGILANNTFRADFIYENISIQNNLIHASHTHGVKKLLFLGSSCIYPKLSPQPIKEEYLLTGPLEYTNEPYAIAKISGIKMCESYFRQYDDNFISVMPTNLYGINDNFELKNSHVLPALLRKFHDAKLSGSSNVEVWGSGNPMREFLHVDDMADACIHIMENVHAEELYDNFKVTHINIGTGEDVSIKELALMIKDIVQFQGDLVFDSTKPDGTPRKLLDVSLLHETGWKHQISLPAGIRKTYDWFLNSNDIRI
ncbi:MAG: GDP-L-fucose synthase [Candidatus Marinimicrobia bacterium]|nr:GDP-L-fucose synthase [Candidatus Neomarinimicrobiota bacterium]MCF7850181.1 GDP-L-fucose synthase [Candidatus Neomarinimicrobiota bacterium]